MSELIIRICDIKKCGKCWKIIWPWQETDDDQLYHYKCIMESVAASMLILHERGENLIEQEYKLGRCWFENVT